MDRKPTLPTMPVGKESDRCDQNRHHGCGPAVHASQHRTRPGCVACADIVTSSRCRSFRPNVGRYQAARDRVRFARFRIWFVKQRTSTTGVELTPPAGRRLFRRLQAPALAEPPICSARPRHGHRQPADARYAANRSPHGLPEFPFASRITGSISM